MEAGEEIAFYNSWIPILECSTKRYTKLCGGIAQIKLGWAHGLPRLVGV